MAADPEASRAAGAGIAVEAGMAVAHWKRRPKTSQTEPAGAATMKSLDSLDMSRGCTTARQLAIPAPAHRGNYLQFQANSNMLAIW